MVSDIYHRKQFRRLLVGRLVSNAGDSIYYVASLWLVHHLSGSELYTGVASFLIMIPGTLSFLVGPVVDKVSVRKILVATHLGQGLLVLAVPVAAMLDMLSVWVVLTVMPLTSLVGQATRPAESSALPRVVEDDELSEANSVFSAAYESVNIVFNAVGGILVGIAFVGATGAFVVDTATFVVAALFFSTLSLPERRSADGDDESGSGEASAEDADVSSEIRTRAQEYAEKFREGVSYLGGSAFLPMVVPEILMNFASGMMLAVLPAFAALRGGSELYGLLLSAMGAGALVGAVLAPRVDALPYGYLLIAGMSMTAVAWFGTTAFVRTPAVVAAFALATVYPAINGVLLNSMTQTVVPEDMIGRVTSAMTSLKGFALPIGSLVGGAAGTAVGSVTVLAGVGVVYLLAVGYFAASPSLRSLPAVDTIDRRDSRIEEFR